MLTSEIWSDRELGSTRTVCVPVRAITMGTANNLDVAGDVPRRLVWSRLDAKMEQPDERKPEVFKHPDILAWAKEQRGRLVHAVLVLVKAWIARGKKPGTQVMGSYEDWASTVGGILDIAGVPGFLSNAAKKRARVDGDVAEWKAFCAAWFEEHAMGVVAVRELYALAQDEDFLPGVTAADTDQGADRSSGTLSEEDVGVASAIIESLRQNAMVRSGVRQYKLETILGSTSGYEISVSECSIR